MYQSTVEDAEEHEAENNREGAGMWEGAILGTTRDKLTEKVTASVSIIPRWVTGGELADGRFPMMGAGRGEIRNS